MSLTRTQVANVNRLAVTLRDVFTAEYKYATCQITGGQLLLAHAAADRRLAQLDPAQPGVLDEYAATSLTGTTAEYRALCTDPHGLRDLATTLLYSVDPAQVA